MNKKSYVKNEQKKNLFACILRGALAALICALIMASVTCLIGLSMNDPNKYIKAFAMASLFTASFVGGLTSARQKGSNTLLCGAFTGIIIIASIALFSLAFSLSMNFALFGICIPCVILISIMGANIGVGMSSGARRKKR